VPSRVGADHRELWSGGHALSVGIAICPANHAWRKGAVEKSAHTIAQRWWRTLGDDVTVAAAQASLDRLCIRFDGRKRVRDGVRTTVGELADADRCVCCRHHSPR
jgi:hypothetical protein